MSERSYRFHVNTDSLISCVLNQLGQLLKQRYIYMLIGASMVVILLFKLYLKYRHDVCLSASELTYIKTKESRQIHVVCNHDV